jgi:hypothetical protein
VGRTQGSPLRSVGYKGYEKVVQYSQKAENNDDSGVTCQDKEIQKKSESVTLE